MELDAISQPELEQIEKIGTADLVVGIFDLERQDDVSSAVTAMLWEFSPQSGAQSLTPCQVLVASAINWVKLTRCCSCCTSRNWRRAASKVTNRCTSACFSSSDQSNQVDSSS